MTKSLDEQSCEINIVVHYASSSRQSVDQVHILLLLVTDVIVVSKKNSV